MKHIRKILAAVVTLAVCLSLISCGTLFPKEKTFDADGIHFKLTTAYKEQTPPIGSSAYKSYASNKAGMNLYFADLENPMSAEEYEEYYQSYYESVSGAKNSDGSFIYSNVEKAKLGIVNLFDAVKYKPVNNKNGYVFVNVLTMESKKIWVFEFYTKRSKL